MRTAFLLSVAVTACHHEPAHLVLTPTELIEEVIAHSSAVTPDEIAEGPWRFENVDITVSTIDGKTIALRDVEVSGLTYAGRIAQVDPALCADVGSSTVTFALMRTGVLIGAMLGYHPTSVLPASPAELMALHEANHHADWILAPEGEEDYAGFSLGAYFDTDKDASWSCAILRFTGPLFGQ